MSAAPLPPTSVPSPSCNPVPANDAAALSQGARIVDTFIAPSKTFTDLPPERGMVGAVSIDGGRLDNFRLHRGRKIGFRKVTENQLQMSPKQSAQLEQLPADQREQQMEKRTAGTKFISYIFPALSLVIWVIIAGALFLTFKFVANAAVPFKTALAIVVYAGLPGLVKVLLATLSVAAGMSPDSFSFQNPVATNLGYFMNPAENVFLYSVASSVDIFLIWTLILTSIGFICASKSRVKSGTSYAIVFGWWAIFTLAGAALGAAFS